MSTKVILKDNKYNKNMRVMIEAFEENMTKENPSSTNFNKLSFVQAPLALLFDHELSDQEKVLYLQVQSFFTRWGYAYPCQDTLAKFNGKKRRAINGILANLENKKMIAKVKDKANHTGYIPMSPKHYRPWIRNQEYFSPAYYLKGQYFEDIENKEEMQKEWDALMEQMAKMPPEDKLKLIKGGEENDNAENLTPPLEQKNAQGLEQNFAHNIRDTLKGEIFKNSDDCSATSHISEEQNFSELPPEKKVNEHEVKTEIEVDAKQEGKTPEKRKAKRTFDNQKVLGASSTTVRAVDTNQEKDNGQGLLNHFCAEMSRIQKKPIKHLTDRNGAIKRNLKIAVGNPHGSRPDPEKYAEMRELMTWTIENWEWIKSRPKGDVFWKIENKRSIDISLFYAECSQRLLGLMHEKNQESSTDKNDDAILKSKTISFA